MTLGESDLFNRNLAKKIQLGWWLVPIRGSPLQSIELGILRISDQGGSWIRMMSNWLWISRRVLMIKEFLQTFCERIFRFFIIILEVRRSHQNKSTWICFHRSQRIFFVAILCWTCVSRMDIGWSLLGDLLNSLST